MPIFYTDSASIERLVVTGSFQITGSLTLTGSSAGSGLTGSLLGTSSWASNAVSATSATSASYSVSSSHAETSDLSALATTSTSASYALTSSAATSITFTPATASYAISASHAQSASWAPGGQGTVGPGTPNTISKFTSTTTIGDSALTENGTIVASTLPISGSSISGSFSGSGVNIIGIVSSSYALSSSFALTSSFSVSASWAPTGGGTVGPGTTNKLAKFTSTTTIGDATLTDDGTFISSSLPISGTSFTGSLFGTASWAFSASNAVSSAWAPGGQSAVGPGTANYVPYFTTTTSVGDSIMSQSNGNALIISGAIRTPLTASAESQIYGDFLTNHSYAVSQSLGTLTGTTTAIVDLRKGQLVFATAGTTANITWRVINSSSIDTVDGFILAYTSGGQATNTWMGGTLWAGGSAPTLTPSGGIDVLTFITVGPNRLYGVLNMRNVK